MGKSGNRWHSMAEKIFFRTPLTKNNKYCIIIAGNGKTRDRVVKYGR